MSLSGQQWERYARHLSLDEIGIEGQKKLLAAKVLVVGAGGLGSPGLLYLAAAGVGTIGIIEFDTVETSNLQRQVLFTTDDIGNLKGESARKRLTALNPDVNVVVHSERLTRENAVSIIKNYDLVVDGTDNFATRYLTNDVCVLLKKPNVFGCVEGFRGQVSVFWHSHTHDAPCYRCLFPEPPPAGEVPTCAEAGVLGILPGVIGLLQATEALKIILNQGSPLTGRLLMYDAMKMAFREVAIRRDPRCVMCGDNSEITGGDKLPDYDRFCGTVCPTQTEKIQRLESGRKIMDQITVEDLKTRLDSGEKPFIIDVRNPDEHANGAIPGAQLIPLGELPSRLSELEQYKGREVIVHCQKGGRSARACGVLSGAGFEKPVNVVGGWEAWTALDK